MTRQNLGALSNSILNQQSQRVPNNRYSMMHKGTVLNQPSKGRKSMKPQRHSISGSSNPTRNYSDKDVQREWKQRILHFLRVEGFPQDMTMKRLSSPYASDIFEIIQFLIQKITPNFKIPFLIEQQNKKKGGLEKTTRQKQKIDRQCIIKVFKSLGYDQPLSENHLKSIGALHTWPHLLAALNWLIDLLLAKKQIEDCIPKEHEQNLGFFNYLTLTYHLFLEEKEEEQIQEEKNLQQRYFESHQKLREEIENKVAESKKIDNQLQECHQRIHQFQNQEEETIRYKEMLQILDTRIQEFQQCERTIRQKLTHENSRDQELSLIIEELMKEKNRLQTILEKQEITPEDVSELQKQKYQQEKLLKSLEERYKSMDEAKEKIEEEYETNRNEIDKLVQEYTDMAYRIKFNFDLELLISHPEDKLFNICLTDLENNHLSKKREETLHLIKKQEQLIFKFQERLKKVSEEVELEKKQQTVLEHELEQLKNAGIEERKLHETQLKELNMELEQIQQTVQSSNKELKELSQQHYVVQQELTRLQQFYKQQVDHCEKEDKMAFSLVESVIRKLNDQKNFTNAAIERVEILSNKLGKNMGL